MSSVIRVLLHKYKSALFLLLGIALTSVSVGQNHFVIPLNPDYYQINDPKYYINYVVDDREDKSDIGFVQKGLFNRNVPAQLKGGLEYSLLNYFQESFTVDTALIPIDILVKKFRISEQTNFSNEFAFAEIDLDFYFNGRLLYSSELTKKTQGLDVTKQHRSNIKSVLLISIEDFEESNWMDKVIEASNEILESKEVPIQKRNKPIPLSLPENEQQTNRNTIAIGYQIGGYSLVGLNYEVRVQDYIGLHFGAGVAGYTAGLKVHTQSDKNSSFFNLSYKDGGFGLINTLGLEFGGRAPFSQRGDFGLHYQLGFGHVQQIDPDFAVSFFPTQEIPDYIFTFGIGFGW